LQGSQADGAALAGELTLLFSALVRTGGDSPAWRTLTPTQRLLLVELCDSGPLRLHALAERAGATDPTTSRAVDGLVAAELVERRADPDDRRAVLHEATGRGRALVKTRRTEVAAFLDHGLAGFRPAERAQLLELLAKLNFELSQPESRPATLLTSR
jgi:MarR family transcriptional regulator, organic hydroperoxide resistance regulator